MDGHVPPEILIGAAAVIVAMVLWVLLGNPLKPRRSRRWGGGDGFEDGGDGGDGGGGD